MVNKQPPVRSIADSMQANNVCPTCQQPIGVGDSIALCQDCGTLNHSQCWDREQCGSYHCRPQSMGGATRAPDFVLTKQEVSNVSMPPRGRLHTTESLAKDVEKIERKMTVLAPLSMLAGLGCFVMAVTFCSGIGALQQFEMFLFIGVMFGGVIATLLSAVTLAQIQRDRRVSGNIPALVGLFAAAFAMGLSIFTIAVRQNEGGGEDMAPVHFDSAQVKNFIARADPRIRGPLMSNVHISVRHGFMGEGQGSGVIMKVADDVAYVLTNLHVLTAGKTVKDLDALKKGPGIIVTFFSGEKKTADPIWLAPYGIDLVMMTVQPPKGYKNACKFQADRLLAIGQRVFAIGNPMGLNWSYTEGVISGIRAQQFGPHEVTVLQMQTPLNPGNSGGGLYDQDGFLVGINTWIYAKSRSEGLNFSIALEGVAKILDPNLLKILTLDSVAKPTGGNNVGPAEAPTSGLQQNR